MQEKKVPIIFERHKGLDAAILRIVLNDNKEVEYYFSTYKGEEKIPKNQFDDFLDEIDYKKTKKYIEENISDNQLKNKYLSILDFLLKKRKTQEEIKKLFDLNNILNFIKEESKKVLKNSQEKLEKIKNIKTTIVKNYFYSQEELNKMLSPIKNLKFDLNGEYAPIEKAIMAQKIANNRPLLLYGTSGSGKTTGVRKFYEKNNLHLEEVTISTKESLKEALFGNIEAEVVNGNVVFKKVNKIGLEAINKVRKEKTSVGLLLDEINRTDEMLKEFTMFSPVYNYKNTGIDCYLIDNSRELKILLVEDDKGNRGFILKGDESDNIYNEELKILPESARIEDLQIANGCGNVTIVNDKSLNLLEKNSKIKVLEELGKIRDIMIIPVEAFSVIATANIGANYDTQDIDIATLQRCITADVSSHKVYKEGKEILSKYRKQKEPFYTKIRELSKEEREFYYEFLENFANIWKNYVDNGQAPDFSFNERLFNLLESINKIPEKINSPKKNALEYTIKNLITEHLISNFIEKEEGLNTVEYNKEQKELLEGTIEKIFELIKNKNTNNIEFKLDSNKKAQKRKQSIL